MNIINLARCGLPFIRRNNRVAAVDMSGQINWTEINVNDLYWRGRNVDKTPPLPDCSHTCLKALHLPGPDHCSAAAKTAWDQAKSSINILISNEKPTKLYRYPIRNSTDMAMSNIGFANGTHLIEVEWPTSMRGTHAVIGVALQGTPANGTGYRNLLGSTETSWGWDIKNNKLLHNGKTLAKYPAGNTNAVFTAPDKITCIIDMSIGTVGFKADDKYLGDAFSCLKGKTVFLAVSAVWGHAKIKIGYIAGEHESTPLSLKDLSKLAIRNHLVNSEGQVADLPLPRCLKSFIADKEIK